jgi:hypothetical protein
MQENTKTLQTPAGNELTLLCRLNASQRNRLRGVMLRSMKVDIDVTHAADARPGDAPTAAPKLKDLALDQITELREHTLIEVAVQKYGEHTSNVLAVLLDGSPEEYDFVVSEAEKALSENNANFI